MQIQVGYIEKPKNSCKSFMKNVKTINNVRLKEPTDLSKPVFLLIGIGNANLAKYNYLYCPEIGYCWLIEAKYVTNDLCELYCERDPLATWADKIYNEFGTIEYCSKIDAEDIYQDDPRLLPDDYYGTKSIFYPWVVSGNNRGLHEALEPSFDQGIVCLCVVGGTVSGVQTQYWIISPRSYFELVEAYVDKFVGNIGDAVKLALGNTNIKENIVSATWLPFSWNTLAIYLHEHEIGTEAEVYIGGWASNTYGYALTTFPSACFTQSRTINVDGSDGSDLKFGMPDDLGVGPPRLRGAKYSKISLIHPGGVVDLSSDAFKYAKTIKMTTVVDLIGATYSISLIPDDAQATDKDGFQLPTITGNIGIDLSGAGGKGFSTMLKGITSISGLSLDIASKYLLGANTNFSSIGKSMTDISPRGGATGSNSLGEWRALSGNTPYHMVIMEAITTLPQMYTRPVTGDATAKNEYDLFGRDFGKPCGQYAKLDTFRQNNRDIFVQVPDFAFGRHCTYADKDIKPFPQEIDSINAFARGGLYMAQTDAYA